MYFIQFSMTQDERKGLILCLKIEFSDGLGGVQHELVFHAVCFESVSNVRSFREAVAA